MSAEIYRAVVVTGNDPMGQGRAKVTIPQISGPAVSTWAIPTSRYAIQPAAGSAVWVSFDSGDPARPVFHSAAPPAPSWSTWAALPGTLGTNWIIHTAQYRTGPGGQVQLRGSVQKTVSPSAVNDTLLTLPSVLWPASTGPDLWWACPYQGGTSSTGAANVALSLTGALEQITGSVGFSGGNLTVNLSPISYTTV